MSKSTSVRLQKPPILSPALKWSFLIAGFAYSAMSLLIFNVLSPLEQLCSAGVVTCYVFTVYGIEIYPRYMKWFRANFQRIERPVYQHPMNYLLGYAFSKHASEYYHSRLNGYQKGDYVYVIKDASASGFYKIGRTNLPSRRVGRFDVIMPFEVHIVAIIPCENMVTLESALHQKFERVRVRGEWFDLDASYLNELLLMDLNFTTGYPEFSTNGHAKGGD